MLLPVSEVIFFASTFDIPTEHVEDRTKMNEIENIEMILANFVI
jgi:hypothetical protein